MKTSFSHLPESKQQELQWVTQLIVETVAPEKIILYGSHATGAWQEDRYSKKTLVYGYDSDYDVLVITKSGERRKDYEISSQIVNRARYRIPVGIITHDIDHINEKLSIGQYFFTDIIKQGILLYDSGASQFVEPKELTSAEKRAIAIQDFDQWFPSAVNFLTLAIHSIESLKATKEGAFLLHQSAERTYNTVLLVFTGYKPKTHNLEKLRSYTRRFSNELYSVFPCDSEVEEHLFSLLQKGYVDARYNDEYRITQEELEVLCKRVKLLQTIAERICKDLIKTF